MAHHIRLLSRHLYEQRVHDLARPTPDNSSTMAAGHLMSAIEAAHDQIQWTWSQRQSPEEAPRRKAQEMVKACATNAIINDKPT